MIDESPIDTPVKTAQEKRLSFIAFGSLSTAVILRETLIACLMLSHSIKTLSPVSSPAHCLVTDIITPSLSLIYPLFQTGSYRLLAYYLIQKVCPAAHLYCETSWPITTLVFPVKYKPLLS